MSGNPDTLAKIDRHIEDNLGRTLDALAKLVAQPSVAAQERGIGECAELVAHMLEAHGFSAEIMPTPGNPVVYGEGSGSGDKTLLFYLHYDVQPAEPFDLWESDPFTLTRRGDAVYGRGISDDKGHIVSRLAALDAVREALGGELPCNVKFVIEGEEEIGSINMPAFVEEHQKKLAADACMWEFGQVNDEGRPMQYLGLRGICYVELSVTTACIDAHSGLAGSIFPNAAWRLVWALNTLKDAEEHILIPGFYENVKPPTARDMELFAAMPDNAPQTLERYQLKGFLKGLTGGLEFRREAVFVPTCTICGLTSGYQEKGSKTVLPAKASAKVDFRLVPDQSPEEVLEKLRAHLDAQGFADIEIEYLGGGRPARTDPDHPFIQLSNAAAADAYGLEPVIAPMIGGSGPNYPYAEVLGLPITCCGIGYPGGQVHAPNEHFRLDDFIKGTKQAARIIEGMGRLP